VSKFNHNFSIYTWQNSQENYGYYSALGKIKDFSFMQNLGKILSFACILPHIKMNYFE